MNLFENLQDYKESKAKLKENMDEIIESSNNYIYNIELEGVVDDEDEWSETKNDIYKKCKSGINVSYNDKYPSTFTFQANTLDDLLTAICICFYISELSIEEAGISQLDFEDMRKVFLKHEGDESQLNKIFNKHFGDDYDECLKQTWDYGEYDEG